MLVTQIARVGFLTGVSMAFTGIVRTIGGGFETAKQVALTANNCTKRSSEYADAKHATDHNIKLMNLKVQQRESLVSYGERNSALRERWDDIPPKIQDELMQWEERFPKL